jgi:hypothetical protein
VIFFNFYGYQYDFDHQTFSRHDGTFGCYKISYDELGIIINSMKFESAIFGVEKR